VVGSGIAGLSAAAFLIREGGRPKEIALGPDDLVFVTDGSMTANSTLGSTDAAPVIDTSRSAGSWCLSKPLAPKRSEFGHPAAFTQFVADSKWESFGEVQRQPSRQGWLHGLHARKHVFAADDDRGEFVRGLVDFALHGITASDHPEK